MGVRVWHNWGHNKASIVYVQKEKKVVTPARPQLSSPNNHAYSGNQNSGVTHIIQLGGIYRKDYWQAIERSQLYPTLSCPECGAQGTLTRHGMYGRNLLVFELGDLEWIKINLVRVSCPSCGSTHALLPADLVAYCQYSYEVLIYLFARILLEGASVPQVAKAHAFPIWSIYLILRRYEQSLARVGLLLYEMGLEPVGQQPFSDKAACIEQIRKYGLNRFQHRYFQYNHHYLWQTRFHNRGSPPVAMGWCRNTAEDFT